MSTLPPLPAGVAQRMLEERNALPGMLPQEIVIFRTWWAEHKSEYTSMDANVRVGRGFDPGPQFLPSVRDAAIKNTQRRLDVLLWQGEQAVVCEVKYRATPLVIGQVTAYRILWARDNPSRHYPEALVLCYQLDDDTEYCCSYMGIPIRVVQADFSGIKLTKQT